MATAPRSSRKRSARSRGGASEPAATPAAAQLRERVKELRCLYLLSRLHARDDAPLENLLRATAAVLPRAWLHPDLASACVTVDGREHATRGFARTAWVQRAEIRVRGRVRGDVEVAYARRTPAQDEGPFLREERHLLDAVARKVAALLIRREDAEERRRLREELVHADRLATIGRVAAGLAHELNEPLGAILGFAQLVRRHPGLPADAVRDLDRVLSSALHAREVVRKLVLFARRTPPVKEPTDLDVIVTQALELLEGRARNAGVRLVHRPGRAVRPVVADPAQIRQVVLNLVLNAVQASARGSEVTVSTRRRRGAATLVVADTGAGMGRDVVDRVFDPFFTTKAVGEGTGLGLSVVQGIVTSHDGTIDVESRPGRGTRFTVTLPERGSEGAA